MPTTRPDPQPEVDRLAQLFGAAALVAADAVREATERAAGLTDAAPAALTCLLPAPGGRSVDELRRIVGLTPSGGVRLIDRLASAGLVRRRPGADRRTVAVVLTAEGRRVAQRVLAAREAALGGLLRDLGVEDRSALTSLAAAVLERATQDRLERRAAGEEPVGGWICRLCDQVRCGRPDGRCPAAATAARPPGPS